MICPYCHSHIKDGLETCPACRKQLSSSVVEERRDSHFCKQCGARLSSTDVTCPSCGMYRDVRDLTPSVSEVKLPELDPGETNAIPRIDSAIPDEDVSEEGKTTSLKPFAVAGILAVVVVTVFTLVIAHPWDPAAYYGRPQEPVDFTKSGPAQIDSLSGQDKKAQTEDLLANSSPYEILNDSYNTIIELNDRVDALQLKFRDYGFSDNDEEIESCAKESRLIAIDVSNEITKINNLNFTGTPYEEQKLKLVKLANLLRNRVDGYSSAWNASKNSSNREADRSMIESYIKKARANQASFNDFVLQAKPQATE